METWSLFPVESSLSEAKLLQTPDAVLLIAPSRPKYRKAPRKVNLHRASRIYRKVECKAHFRTVSSALLSCFTCENEDITVTEQQRMCMFIARAEKLLHPGSPAPLFSISLCSIIMLNWPKYPILISWWHRYKLLSVISIS